MKTKGKVNGKENELVAASEYLSYDEEMPSPIIRNVVTYCEEEELDLVVEANANAHNLW